MLLQQALVDKRCYAVQNINVQITLGVADSLRDLERAASGKDTEPGEEPLLGFRQEVVAPVDCAAEGLVARRYITCSPCKKLQSVGQSPEERLGGKETNPGSGQFDGQGQPFESSADQCHIRRRLIGEGEVGLCCL